MFRLAETLSHTKRHALYAALRYNRRTCERFNNSSFMIQRSIQFCHICGSRAAPRALYCVDCGARLAPTGRHARSPRPAGVRVGGRYRLRRLIKEFPFAPVASVLDACQPAALPNAVPWSGSRQLAIHQ